MEWGLLTKIKCILLTIPAMIERSPPHYRTLLVRGIGVDSENLQAEIVLASLEDPLHIGSIPRELEWFWAPFSTGPISALDGSTNDRCFWGLGTRREARATTGSDAILPFLHWEPTGGSGNGATRATTWNEGRFTAGGLTGDPAHFKRYFCERSMLRQLAAGLPPALCNDIDVLSNMV
jgi:hypothetical protein